MKIALYIEDGLEQIVLTPEGKTESSILEKLHDGSRSFELRRGAFFECRGGWVRHTRGMGDNSTMVIMRPAIATEAGTDETQSGSAEGKGAGRKASPKS